MKKKGLIAVIVAIVLVIALLVIWKLAAPTANEGSKTINVTITHLDESVKEVEIKTDAETLWDAMDEQGLIEGVDDTYGKWITAVDGESADSAQGQYWLFTKGGEYVETGCETTYIADGESYEFYIGIF